MNVTERRRSASGLLSAVLLACTVGCSAGGEGEASERLPQDTTGVAPAGVFEGTTDEWVVATVECLRDAGWDAEADLVQDGIEIPSFTYDQRAALKRARAECTRSVGALPKQPPLSAEEIGLLYDYYVEELTPCLTQRGYQVDDPPSRDAFIEKYYDLSGSGSWYPYQHVDPAGEAAWLEINQECPQSPEDFR